jgi:nucleoside-diphosphate-sugar epimerase
MAVPTALVTGANGLLGAHLLKHLVSSGIAVRAMVRPQANLELWQKLWPEVTESWPFELFEGDFLDMFDLEKALEGIDAVFHTAGMVSFYRKDHQAMMHVNARGTAGLVNAMLAVRPKAWLCHVSSIAALGRSNKPEKINENRSWKKDPANTGYARSKYAAELEVWRGVEEGLDAVVVNPSVILGPVPDWNKNTGKLFTQVNKGLTFAPPGTTGFVDVLDVAHIMHALYLNRCTNQRFILNGENASWMHILSTIAAEIGKPAPRKKAGKTLLNLLPYLRFLPGLPQISREMVSNSMQENMYSSDKISNYLEFGFTPISQTIARVANAFLIDANAKN